MERSKELLDRFNRGKLSPQEMVALEQMVEAGLVDLEEIPIFKQALNQLSTEEEIHSSEKLDHTFYKIISDEKASNKPSIFRMNPFQGWRLALTLGFASIAFFLGTQVNLSRNKTDHPIKEKDLLTQVMSTKDVNDRIHLVSSTPITETVDQQVTEALLFSLINDSSTNVRLASIDALLNYVHLDLVRSGLIKAISHQSSPVVLTYLAEAIQLSGQPLEQEDFKKLLDNDLPPPLLQSMVEVIPTL